MSAREVINLIESLSASEQRKVFAFVEDKKLALAGKSPRKRMNFRDAKKHVFATYRDVLEKLAK